MPPFGTPVPRIVLLRLGRRFGLAEARELQQTLAGVAPGSHLMFDFSAVREFQDVAVASLAQALVRLGTAAEVRGLSLHQRRMLRYFGVDLDASAEELDTSNV